MVITFIHAQVKSQLYTPREVAARSRPSNPPGRLMHCQRCHQGGLTPE